MRYFLMRAQSIRAYPNPEDHFNELLMMISKLTAIGDELDLGEFEEEYCAGDLTSQNVSAVEDDGEQFHSPTKPFKAYGGNRPFIFISYAHKDAQRVFDEIKNFHEAGYPVWYDQGLTPGQEWDEEIALALMNCRLLVVFISKNSMASKNVQDEIKMALNRDINVVPIYLEETELPPALELRLSTKHAIYRYLADESDFLYECFKAFDNAGIPSDEK
jgi:hypothetical protein